MMTVSELIDLLQKCRPDATVEFAYESDGTTTGNSIRKVAQFVFYDSEDEDEYAVVQLRG